MLRIDLCAVVDNWRALSRKSAGARTAAVVKADAYGLGADRVAPALAAAGARDFFVALVAEGVALRKALGAGPRIFVLSGHMAGEAEMIAAADLIPCLNSAEQFYRDRLIRQGDFAIQLDTGMNRLGLEPSEWAAIRPEAEDAALVMSHLACADAPDDPANAAQRAQFCDMTQGMGAPRSLSATGGILLGPDYHFDLTRPGIGIYGGLPFEGARPVVRLSLPVIQTRLVNPDEGVGYGYSWQAARPSRIATVAGGYADGLARRLQDGRLHVFAGDRPCPVVGRVSMDLITVDVTDLDQVPDTLDILGPHQGVDDLAEHGGTIGYEVLTALGRRYRRQYVTEESRETFVPDPALE